ncbi:MAG: TolB-like translocation protein [Planctomycetota bacterium]|jgi:Tol biopolymer transport system component
MNLKRSKHVGYRNPLIALSAALSCLVLYILACVTSPVTWSPDSSKIALLVTPPGDDPNKFAIFTYDIAAGERLLLDDLEADGVLSAPSWSPDGKWIAYYRVDPSPPAGTQAGSPLDPNAALSPARVSTENVSDKNGAPAPKTSPAEKLFTEDNRMLPPFLWDILEEKTDENEDGELFDVKLMIATPDGKERKVLKVLQWQGDDDDRKMLVLMKPEWSPDSGRLFYARMLGPAEMFYFASLDIPTGQMHTHLLGSFGTCAASPDGRHVASLLKIDSDRLLLTIAKTDGTAQKFFELGESEDTEGLFFLSLSWSPDSKTLLVPAKEEVLMVDADTGSINKCRDPETGPLAYGTFSPDGTKLYYLAGYELDDPNSHAKPPRVSLRYTDFKNKKTKEVFELGDFPDSMESGIFSISPDCKTVLLRCLLENQPDGQRSTLVFWDGKSKKTVETDRWLMKPFYTH